MARDFNIELEWNISNANEPVNEAPLTKGNSRAARRKATRKAKRHLREIEPFTMSVRPTRNGGIIHKGDTYSWLPYWKRMNSRIARHEGKKEIADFLADDSQPFDAWEDWNGMYFDEHFPTREDGTIDLDAVWREEHPTYEDDEDDDDDGYEYRRYYDPETGDHVVECVETEEHKLTREINLYKDFLGEYNLGKLFKSWLATNGKERLV